MENLKFELTGKGLKETVKDCYKITNFELSKEEFDLLFLDPLEYTKIRIKRPWQAELEEIARGIETKSK